MPNQKKMQLYLAAPRGFCAGVIRAIEIVENALQEFGSPVYVRHEIVHNRYVVDALRKKGAIFVEHVEQAPPDRPIIFSAHGVPKSVPQSARHRNMHYVDATCPLVSKVHREAERLVALGAHIFLIGHAGHPEVEGTMGQVEIGHMTLVETLEDAKTLSPPNSGQLAYVTQTTLSVDDTADIIAELKRRFPAILAPAKADICYATTNRQEAVKAIAPNCDLLLVIGSKASSNSRRLFETALVAGAADARLIDDKAQINWSWFDGVHNLGLTAGASAPEKLVNEVIETLQSRCDVTLHEIGQGDEKVVFRAPPVTRRPLDRRVSGS